jgi:hypothetical protein
VLARPPAMLMPPWPGCSWNTCSLMAPSTSTCGTQHGVA